MRGEIRSRAFDDRNSLYCEQGRSPDRSLVEISYLLWTIHDDFIDHPISVSPEAWAALERSVAFLRTDLEAPAKTRRAPVPPAWPFHDEPEWLAHEHLIRDSRIPEYDPAIHGRVFQPWWNRIPTTVGLAVIFGLLAVTVLTFALCRGL